MTRKHKLTREEIERKIDMLFNRVSRLEEILFLKEQEKRKELLERVG